MFSVFKLEMRIQRAWDPFTFCNIIPRAFEPFEVYNFFSMKNPKSHLPMPVTCLYVLAIPKWQIPYSLLNFYGQNSCKRLPYTMQYFSSAQLKVHTKVAITTHRYIEANCSFDLRGLISGALRYSYSLHYTCSYRTKEGELFGSSLNMRNSFDRQNYLQGFRLTQSLVEKFMGP